MSLTSNLRMHALSSIIKPIDLITQFPVPGGIAAFIQEKRQAISNIIKGQDNRILVIVGPCSIHDIDSALDYATRLKKLNNVLEDELLLVMRLYFEKPRTTFGWKGLIADPTLNGEFDFNVGLTLARKLLLAVNSLGLPAATEFLDNHTHYYLEDLISWCAIGARTVESPIHRELASGLSMPLGFKNNTDGNLKVAVDAVRVASQPHQFLGITPKGNLTLIQTKGNPHCHIILRGSNNAPNYSIYHLEQALELLKKHQLKPFLMVDCSHGNSQKDFQKQSSVFKNFLTHIQSGMISRKGIMLESNLIPGQQSLNPASPLQYGQSITDGCIGWEETETLLHMLAARMRTRSSRYT